MLGLLGQLLTWSLVYLAWWAVTRGLGAAWVGAVQGRALVWDEPAATYRLHPDPWPRGTDLGWLLPFGAELYALAALSPFAVPHHANYVARVVRGTLEARRARLAATEARRLAVRAEQDARDAELRARAAAEVERIGAPLTEANVTTLGAWLRLRLHQTEGRPDGGR